MPPYPPPLIILSFLSRAKQTSRWAYFLLKAKWYVNFTVEPLLSTFTDLWITILIFWKTQISIVITLDWEGMISVFLSLKRITESRHFFYQCAKEWNILVASFKEMNTLLLFKQNIKSCIFYSFSLFEKWAACIKIVIVIIIVISKIQDLVVNQRVIRRSKRHTMDINTYVQWRSLTIWHLPTIR